MTTDDGQVAVFVTIDHATAELVGVHASKRATRYEALEPLRQGVRAGAGRQRLRGASDPYAQGAAAVGASLRHRRGLRLALIAWAELYNREWPIERHGFKSPATARQALYENREKLAA